MSEYGGIRERLIRIYGVDKGSRALDRIVGVLRRFPRRPATAAGFFSQADTVLISYGDSLRRTGEKPLRSFHRFALERLREAFTTVHFLPFYPYSSDDGFSVIDFFAVNPELGTWDDIADMEHDFRLMFDYVLNHVSARSQWFQNYLQDRPGFEDLAIEVDPSLDLSMVTRPRSLPLLTPFTKADGRTVHVWTTFSADQIDLNFKSLNVLEKMIRVMLHYVDRGAAILRLDAIAYLWKEIGTSCIHLPQTHEMVKLFRAILDLVAPDVVILTETNVPHQENISYFGNGRDEAQMVYNFTLPPLLLHTFIREDATELSRWAAGLSIPSEHNTFFNFTASHDGIGVRPLEGILPPRAVDELVEVVTGNGGRVSYKRNPDGTDSPYELNITYVDALKRPGDDDDLHARRFLCSQAIQYVLPGVPATYIHSLLGSHNWQQGVERTGMARSINRQKLNLDELVAELADPASFRSKVFYPYLHLIAVRRAQPAFHPNSGFEILELGRQLFAIRRFCEQQELYAVANISSRPAGFTLPGGKGPWFDLLSSRSLPGDSCRLGAYDACWLTSERR